MIVERIHLIATIGQKSVNQSDCLDNWANLDKKGITLHSIFLYFPHSEATTQCFPVFAADLIQQMKSQDTKLCPYKVIQDLNQISSNDNGNLYQIVLNSTELTTQRHLKASFSFA